jgi:hypothetical protein
MSTLDLTALNGRSRTTSVRSLSSGQEAVPDMNHRGELLYSMALPERAELVRLGDSWGAQIPTASAFTFVAAWPTTRAELVLSNAEPAGTGKTYIIDRVWMTNITSQAAAQHFSILAQINPTANAIAAGTDNTAVLRQSLSGYKKVYNGNGRLLVANTAFALANQWMTIGMSAVSPMTTNLGASAEAFVYGRYLVPPGAQFCVAGLAGTAAGTAICGIEWHEVYLPLV